MKAPFVLINTMPQYPDGPSRLEDATGEYVGSFAHRSVAERIQEHVCDYVTTDAFPINPRDTKVYWYAKWHSDGFPTFGYLQFDNENREWKFPNGCEEVFLRRENVDRFIEQRKAANESIFK